jgi:hypothetical protein
MKKLMDVEKKMKRSRKLVKSKLANLREKIKAVSDARKSLDFFYPTSFVKNISLMLCMLFYYLFII